MRNLNNDEQNPQKLLRTPPPFTDECLMGYVLRLTQANGYTTPSWIFDLAGMKINLVSGGSLTLYNVNSDLAAFQHITGLSNSECEKINYRWIEFKDTVAVSDHHIPIDSIRFVTPKVCPGCLKQEEYCRIVWNLSPFTACPSHNTVLIDRCPRCNKRLSWLRNRVSGCRCGFDWRDAVGGELGPSELNLSRRISRLFCPSSGEDLEVNESNNPIYGLEAGDLFHALGFVADWYLFTHTGRHLRTNTENVLCHQAYTRAVDAFNAWPHNFNVFLDQAKRLSGKKIGDSIFYRQVDQLCRRSALYFIAIAIEDYVEKNESNLGCEGWVQAKPSRIFLTKSAACRSLRIEPKWLDLLIEQGKLEVTQRWDESEVLICGESVINFENRLHYFLHIWHVAKALSVEPEDVEDLISYNCLKAESGPDVDGLPNWGFTKDNLYSFVNAISARITISDNDKPEDLIGAKEVIRRLRRLNIGLGRFTADVLNWTIVPAADTPRLGFEGLLFRKKDVADYLKRLGEVTARKEWQPDYTPKYKLWTKALIEMEEVNLRIITPSTVRSNDDVLAVSVDVDDLAEVAMRVFGRDATEIFN